MTTFRRATACCARFSRQDEDVSATQSAAVIAVDVQDFRVACESDERYAHAGAWTELDNCYLSDSIGKRPGIVWKLAACEQAHLPILMATPGLRAIAVLEEIRRRHPEIGPVSLPKRHPGNHSAHYTRGHAIPIARWPDRQKQI